MCKSITLIVLGINLLVPKSIVADKPSQKEEDMSVVETFVWCGVGIGAIGVGIGAIVVTIVYAPVVISAAIAGAKVTATVVAAKAVTAGAAIKTGCVVAGPVAIKLNTAFFVGKFGKKLFYSNSEDKLQAVLIQESSELSEAKLNLEKCLNDYRTKDDTTYIPRACKEKAKLYALLVQDKFVDENPKRAQLNYDTWLDRYHP